MVVLRKRIAHLLFGQPKQHTEQDVRIGEWSGDIRHALMAYTAPFNLTGYPAATIPMPRPPGLMPAGLQIVGRRGGDAEVMDAAIEFEKLLNAASSDQRETEDGRSLTHALQRLAADRDPAHAPADGERPSR
jgi:hypothetical protein